jgi:hypothetical protein
MASKVGQIIAWDDPQMVHPGLSWPYAGTNAVKCDNRTIRDLNRKRLSKSANPHQTKYKRTAE